MKTILKLSLLTILTLFLTACNNKSEKVDTSKNTKKNQKVENILVKNIIDDNIQLKSSLTKELSKNLNTIKDEKKSDATVKTQILKSNANYTHYLKPTTTIKCLNYKIENSKRVCIKYGTVELTCTKKEFIVKTKISLLNKSKETIFSKIYEETIVKNQCPKLKHHITTANKIYKNKNTQKRKNNTKLAKIIAKEFVSDISINLNKPTQLN